MNPGASFDGRTTGDPYDVITNLQVALESGDLIGQAKGILMERHGITAEQALARLQSMAQSSDLRVHDVATHVVELRRDPASSAPSAAGA